jgi:hypothetical protein
LFWLPTLGLKSVFLFLVNFIRYHRQAEGELFVCIPCLVGFIIYQIKAMNLTDL